MRNSVQILFFTGGSSYKCNNSKCREQSDFPVCTSSEYSATTKLNWTFESLVNSEQTSNTPRTFE